MAKQQVTWTWRKNQPRTRAGSGRGRPRSNTRTTGPRGGRGKVKAHTRTVNGRQVKVRQHGRKLNPGRAGRNAMRAYRAAKGKRHGAALALGALAVGEFAGWFTLRGTSVGLTVLGVGLVGIGLAARSLAR